MIKKLKIKFIAINITLVFIVLAIAFVTIYVSTSRQIVQETTSVMQRMLNAKDSMEPPKLEIGGDIPEAERKDDRFRAAFSVFAVQLDENHKIIKVFETMFRWLINRR